MPQVLPVGPHPAAEADSDAMLPLAAPVPKSDQPFFTCLLPHWGHLTSTSEVMERTNFSNWVSQSWQLYS
jgi:hypothetical protein